MNRKFVISVVVMFLMSWALGFLAHGVLLHNDYARFPNLMRTMADAQAKLHKDPDAAATLTAADPVLADPR